MVPQPIAGRARPAPRVTLTDISADERHLPALDG